MRFLYKVLDILYYIIFGPIKYARYKGVHIGDECRIYIRSWGSEPFLISIGDNVTITSGVKFITHDGSTCLVKNELGERFQNYGHIKIGSNVFVGINSIILPNVSICDNVVIGAGTIVCNDIKTDGIYVGVPAKKISSFNEYVEKIKKTCISNDKISGSFSYEDRISKAIYSQNEKRK